MIMVPRLVFMFVAGVANIGFPDANEVPLVGQFDLAGHPRLDDSHRYFRLCQHLARNLAVRYLRFPPDSEERSFVS